MDGLRPTRVTSDLGAKHGVVLGLTGVATHPKSGAGVPLKLSAHDPTGKARTDVEHVCVEQAHAYLPI